MDLFSIYDLTVESCVSIPEVARVRPDPGATTEPDITIRCESVETNRDGPDRLEVSVDDRVVSLSVPEVGWFEIRDGTTITVDSVTELSDQQVRAVLTGPALGYLLYQRGLLVLHGSAVARDGAGYLFLGTKGAGKSTTAGTLARQGYAVLSDDVTVIDVRDGALRLLPGRPHLKLADDRFAFEVFPSTASLEMTKQYYRVPEPAPRAPERIGAVFLLERGSELAVEELPPSAAVWGVLEQLYVRQFSDELNSERCFEQATALVDRTSIRRLVRPDDTDALSEIPSLITDVDS
ncbi:hypothetical protein [Natronococcus sp. A-GB7]|uniref:hypothetical protein n=1 Tax=Natronococcus sp. A-GB7 TaxID=3037649 RepID=UPI00241C93D1|nr:hypothetical protein [Natronococcus sp. A-GB7]MDG5819711.1 hypothetical protein [Natronococcus sp. A-GB7]